MNYTYQYPHPSVTVDCVIFERCENELKIMLIKRGIPPYKDKWALPGGFVNIDESLEHAAMRELKEETGIEHVYLEQLHSFGDPGRDPRERVITVAYYALVNSGVHAIKASTDAIDASWFSIYDLPELAFDHKQIIEMAISRLRAKIQHEPIGFELLPKKFTLRELQSLYEIILNKKIDKRNFRKKILGFGFLDQLKEKEIDVRHRAAGYYSFNPKKYKQLKKNGNIFEC